MNRLLALAAVVVVACGAAGYLLQSARRGPESVPLSASGFDINYVPPPARPAAIPSAPQASPVAAAPAAPPVVEPPRAAKPPAPAAPAGAIAQITAILTSPAKFLVAKTYFGSAAKLQGFLQDQNRMRNYMLNPITREALDSPTLIKLLARPAVAHAFLASPAMSDDRAVSALMGSPLLGQVLRSPGVQEALADPELVAGLMQDPQVAQWLGRHPSATIVLNQAQAAR